MVITETAPIFNKLGITGQALKPLQTFGQQQLANWISDFRYMKATDPKHGHNVKLFIS